MKKSNFQQYVPGAWQCSWCHCTLTCVAKSEYIDKLETYISTLESEVTNLRKQIEELKERTEP